MIVHQVHAHQTLPPPMIGWRPRASDTARTRAALTGADSCTSVPSPDVRLDARRCRRLVRAATRCSARCPRRSGAASARSKPRPRSRTNTSARPSRTSAYTDTSVDAAVLGSVHTRLAGGLGEGVDGVVHRRVADDHHVDAHVVRGLDLRAPSAATRRRANRPSRPARRRGAVQPLAQLALLLTGERDGAARVVGRSLDERQRLQHRVVQVRRHRLTLLRTNALTTFGCGVLGQPGEPRPDQRRDSDDGERRGERTRRARCSTRSRARRPRRARTPASRAPGDQAGTGPADRSRSPTPASPRGPATDARRPRASRTPITTRPATTTGRAAPSPHRPATARSSGRRATGRRPRNATAALRWGSWAAHRATGDGGHREHGAAAYSTRPRPPAKASTTSAPRTRVGSTPCSSANPPATPPITRPWSRRRTRTRPTATGARATGVRRGMRLATPDHRTTTPGPHRDDPCRDPEATLTLTLTPRPGAVSRVGPGSGQGCARVVPDVPATTMAHAGGMDEQTALMNDEHVVTGNATGATPDPAGFRPPGGAGPRPPWYRLPVFRDTSDDIAGGVVSGLCRTYGFDRRTTRIALLLASFVLPVLVLVYVFAWILLPDDRASALPLADVVTDRRRLPLYVALGLVVVAGGLGSIGSWFVFGDFPWGIGLDRPRCVAVGDTVAAWRTSPGRHRPRTAERRQRPGQQCRRVPPARRRRPRLRERCDRRGRCTRTRRRPAHR